MPDYILPEVERIYLEGTDNLDMYPGEIPPLPTEAPLPVDSSQLPFLQNVQAIPEGYAGDMYSVPNKDVDTGILSALMREYQSLARPGARVNPLLAGASTLSGVPMGRGGLSSVLGGIGRLAQGYATGQSLGRPKGPSLADMKTISEVYRNLREPKTTTPKAENPFNVVLGLSAIDNPALLKGMTEYYARQYGMRPEEIVKAVEYGKLQDRAVKDYVDNTIALGSGNPQVWARLTPNQKAQALAILKLYSK